MNTRSTVVLAYAVTWLTAYCAHAADDAFIKSVAAMPPEEQVKAVVVKLKVLNPQFDCLEQHKIEGGAVTELSFSTVGVTDISPVKALSWLRKLTVAPAKLDQKGALADLAPLSGMQLTWLWCHNNPIKDLTPLHGMPLTVLSISGTRVTDLSPLAGMKLQVLSFNDTLVTDLSSLGGMPLTVLWCNNTQVKDLSPLKGMLLQQIKCDFVAARDAVTLRDIKPLAKINDMPAQVFWARVGPIAAANMGADAASRSAAPTTPSRTANGVPVSRAGAEKTMMTSTGMELVWIPPGEFMMGSTAKERSWAEHNSKATQEGVQPRATRIANGFWMARTELTVGQWQKFADSARYLTDAEKEGRENWRQPKAGFSVKANHPVIWINWHDAVAYCQWLTETEKQSNRLPAGMIFRLPTEAEWEYACRAGTQTKFWWGEDIEGGERRLNWKGAKAALDFVAPVDNYGARGRNKLGLADMLGNVSEWCLDEFDPEQAHEDCYKGNAASRVIRGSSFAQNTGYVRCAYRYSCRSPAASYSSVGFRVVLGIER